MCADNETIVNGSHFYKLSSVQEEDWCRKLLDSDGDVVMAYYYMGDKWTSAAGKRRISLVRRLNYYREMEKTKLIRIDLNYATLEKGCRRLNSMHRYMSVRVTGFCFPTRLIQIIKKIFPI